MAAFEKALQGFEEIQGSTPELFDVRANAGILKVTRGDYTQALDLFYANAIKKWGTEEEGYQWNAFADYWGDVAYLAERVLTIDELREYIDHHLTAATADAAEKTNDSGARTRLKSILARRLMRAERRSEALRYFEDPKIRAAAQQYDKNLNETNSSWRPGFLKAQAWFRAAKIARENGMEILGFERDPDWAMWDGLYEPYDEQSNDQQAAAKPVVETKDPFESDDERGREDSSESAYDSRYQYRMTAVDEAEKAADALPVKSQAYAAVLCTASSWVIDREPERAEKVYQRYVKNGAYVKWGSEFARTCPAPDFGVDSVHGISRRVRRVRQHVKAHPLGTALAGVGGIGMVVAAIYFGWVRTRRAATFV